MVNVYYFKYACVSSYDAVWPLFGPFLPLRKFIEWLKAAARSHCRCFLFRVVSARRQIRNDGFELYPAFSAFVSRKAFQQREMRPFLSHFGKSGD